MNMKVFKYGGEDALQYMLTQFEVGTQKGCVADYDATVQGA